MVGGGRLLEPTCKLPRCRESAISLWRIYEKAPFEETEGLGSFTRGGESVNDYLEGAMNIVFDLSADEVFVLIRGGDSSNVGALLLHVIGYRAEVNCHDISLVLLLSKLLDQGILLLRSLVAYFQ
eukprot:scaffold2487_cov98-Skeletonema_dohrnii-CCMP3373.AAC.1